MGYNLAKIVMQTTTCIRKVIMILFTFLLFSSASYSQDVLFKNDKLVIEKHYRMWGVERETQSIRFYNLTNNTIRVSFTATYNFTIPNAQYFTVTETVYIKPQGINIWWPAEKQSEYAFDYSLIIRDFKLNNYSVKEENYEVPW